MNYAAGDPRAGLATTPKTKVAGPFDPPQFVDLTIEPSARGTDARSRVVRGYNYLLRYSELAPGAALTREGILDESMVLLVSDSGSISVESNAESVELSAPGVVIVPAGDSRVTARAEVVVVEILTIVNAARLPRAENEQAFRETSGHASPFVPWTSTTAPRGLRAYPLDEVPADPTRFGRIFRSEGIMINFLSIYVGPRSADKLSPHHHDDFEQGSLIIRGDYTHYVRTPWTTNLEHWVPDVAQTMGGPSLAVIPPPLIHTSRAIGAGINQMIDIFAPPRVDFEEKGWVVNADDYRG